MRGRDLLRAAARRCNSTRQEESEPDDVNKSNTENDYQVSKSSIPRFYTPRPNTALAKLCNKEARARMLRDSKSRLPTKEDQRTAMFLLERAGDTDARMIDYESFVALKDKVPSSCQCFFTGSTFLLFKRDEQGRIPTSSTLKYITNKVSLSTTHIEVGLCAQSNGRLSRKDLGKYIYDMLPSLPQVAGRLEESLQSYYIDAVVAKFFFFLPHPHGTVSVEDVLTSPMLVDLLDLKHYSPSSTRPNFFSATSFRQLYGQFQRLDTNKDGYLDAMGLLQWCPLRGSVYGTRTRTIEFLRQVLASVNTHNNLMGFKEFLDWSIAMEDKKTPQSLKYFLNILDINQVGYLDKPTMTWYLKGVMRTSTQMGCNTVPPDDVIDEIFDMVSPAHPERVTHADLVRSKYGDTVLHMLADAHSFYCYDNRETLKQEEQEDEDPLSPETPSPVATSTNVSKSDLSRVLFSVQDEEQDGDEDGLYNF